ncbi:DUF1472 domain-containing protein, partial [Salmonella enterica]|nr:DUF1472 domain-containing protein [Salmonella enterica]
IARLVWMHGTARCRGICDYGGLPCNMQHVSTPSASKNQTACLSCRICSAPILCWLNYRCMRWPKNGCPNMTAGSGISSVCRRAAGT